MSALCANRSFLVAACCLAFALSVCSNASAGIVLSFDPSTRRLVVPTAGSVQFTMGVQIAADTGTQLVKTYNLPIDLQAPVGRGLPQGWSIVSASRQFLGFTEAIPAFDANSTNPAEGDLIVSDGNLVAPISLGTTPVTLFDFTVSIDSTAIAGDYLAGFVNQSLLAVSDQADARIPNAQMQFNTASIRLTAVPEPGSLGIVAICLVLVPARWHRRTAVPLA